MVKHKMNKITKILLSFLGGMDVLITCTMPILLAVIWVTLFGFKNFGSYILIVASICSAIFRSIKIGWIKK
jgi:hypothetical protein